MKIDPVTSTVTIAGRRFPAAYAICPPHPDAEDPGSDWDRRLGGPEGPGEIIKTVGYLVMIPCENGLLVSVEMTSGQPGYEIHLYARACRTETWNDEVMWMPCYVSIVGGRLIAELPDRRRGIRVPLGPWRWDNAEPDWTVELIDRVSAMPFTQPDGPQVRLIPLSAAETATIP